MNRMFRSIKPEIHIIQRTSPMFQFPYGEGWTTDKSYGVISWYTAPNSEAVAVNAIAPQLGIAPSNTAANVSSGVTNNFAR